ncbi:MAG: TetR/AcrR family transcriptional regulator [Phycisphaerales bacterium]
MTAALSQPPATREKLLGAAMRVVARTGPAASVRAIAREAGLTEGALYRHFPSRDHLLGAAFAELVEPMIAEKENLVAMRVPARDRLREWVRCTYARFDRQPDAFAYVFLTPHEMPKEYAKLSGRQSTLLKALLQQASDEGTPIALPIDIAAHMFVAMLLAIPSAIYRKRLPRPASDHVDEVADAIWRALNNGAESRPTDPFRSEPD